MKSLSKFSTQKLSNSEMRLLKGGYVWCYAWDCTCGSTGYNGWGNLNDYRADAQDNCSPGVPVECTFGDRLDVC